jgi:hypothetical protein
MISCKTISLTCPAVISKFEKHAELKQSLLDNMVGESYTTVSKTDWNLPRECERPYVQIIKDPLFSHLSEVYLSIGYPAFSIENIWAQQYIKDSTHPWHLHESCNFTNIYYVELPEGTPSTQFLDSITKHTFSFDVEEGDILTVPSTFIHRSPPNLSELRKTVIAFNTNVYVR